MKKIITRTAEQAKEEAAREKERLNTMKVAETLYRYYRTDFDRRAGTCPNCGKDNRADTTPFGGRSYECRHCGTAWNVCEKPIPFILHFSLTQRCCGHCKYYIEDLELYNNRAAGLKERQKALQKVLPCLCNKIGNYKKYDEICEHYEEIDLGKVEDYEE